MIVINGWYFLAKPTRFPARPCNAFIAMAKREPFVTGGDCIREPGDLWFQFGPTKEEALARLKTEVFALVLEG